MVANTEQDWNAYKSTGKKVVPAVMTDWDTRPDPSRVGEPYWAQATPQEIAAHLQNALKWIAANPCAALQDSDYRLWVLVPGLSHQRGQHASASDVVEG